MGISRLILEQRAIPGKSWKPVGSQQGTSVSGHFFFFLHVSKGSAFPLARKEVTELLHTAHN